AGMDVLQAKDLERAARAGGAPRILRHVEVDVRVVDALQELYARYDPPALVVADERPARARKQPGGEAKDSAAHEAHRSPPDSSAAGRGAASAGVVTSSSSAHEARARQGVTVLVPSSLTSVTRYR